MRFAFKNACIAFDVERLETHRALTAALAAAGSEPKQLKLLRNQVRHHLHGLGLKQEPFGPTLAFSSTGDPSIGTIDDLTARVKRMITRAPPPWFCGFCDEAHKRGPAATGPW